MQLFNRVSRGSKVTFLIGAIIGVVAIKTQPDGNLLVTSVCALISGTIALGLWLLLTYLMKL